MYGFTTNYIKVRTRYNETLINTIQEVKLENVQASGVVEISFNPTSSLKEIIYSTS